MDDPFRRFTLFDNRILVATAQKLPDGKYAVTLHVHAARCYADDSGQRTPGKLDIPIEVGMCAWPRNAALQQERPLYLAKLPLRDGGSTINLTLDGKPCAAGIGPCHELTDRQSDDNRADVTVR